MADPAELRRFILGKINHRLNKLNIKSDSVPDDFDLIESGAIDSMEFINLIGEIEIEFGIEVDLSGLDPSEFTTLRGLANSASMGGSLD